VCTEMAQAKEQIVSVTFIPLPVIQGSVSLTCICKKHQPSPEHSKKSVENCSKTNFFLC
jgi:hypothetical protein